MPTANQWLPAENFVRNAVRGNYTVAMKVSTFHLGALNSQSANPVIEAALLIYEPVHQALVDASSTKLGSVGERISDTQTKDELLLVLTQQKLPVWVQLIGNTYLPGTAGYTNLFPGGLEVFHVGTIENKILELKTLRDKCLLDAALATVAALIATFYTQINNAKGAQEGEKSDVTFNIGDQKDAVENMCVTQFADYGIIVNLFPNNPDKIKSFFDVVTMQNHVHSDIYEGIVHAGKIKKAAIRLVTADSKILVTSDVDLQVWVNKSAKTKAHPVGGFVPANTPTILNFPALGNPDNRVFQVHNLSLTTSGNYSVEFL